MAGIEHNELEERLLDEGEATHASTLREVAEDARALEYLCTVHVLVRIAVLEGVVVQTFELSCRLRVDFGQPQLVFYLPSRSSGGVADPQSEAAGCVFFDLEIIVSTPARCTDMWKEGEFGP